MFSFESIKNWFLISVIVIFSISLFFQHLHLRKVQKQRDEAVQQVSILSFQISQQNDAIVHWEKEGDALSVKLKLIEREANRKHLQDKKHVEKIMNEKVSKNCNSAIHWGIEQAQKIN